MAAQPLKRCPSPLHVGERELPLEAFSKQTDKKDGRRAWCKARVTAQYHLDPSKQRKRSRKWYDANKETHLANERRKYYENPEIRKRQAREWVLKNPERARASARRSYARNIEIRRERSRIYQRNRRDYYRAALIRYRAREKAAGGNVTKEKLAARWLYYLGRCWMCGDEATAWDHVKPVSAGGGSWASNLRPACRPCNLRKRAAWPFPTNIYQRLGR
jgi:5-methylcytosine-specific restriction endonuclease McrA